MSEAVIAALEAALAGAPDPLPIRRHLASLLLDAGRPAEALDHCGAVLAAQPDDAGMLALASRCAAAAGRESLAASYARMAAALGGDSTEDAGPARIDSQEGAVVPLRVLDADEDDPDAPERPRVRLADVGGMEAVKRRLEMSFLAPMRNPQLREMYGKSLRGGLLLWGPPGCGKTFIARATAGELGARFIAIGLTDVLDMWFGNSERNLHAIFEQARRNAPCVVFLDELDALGAKRVNFRAQQQWRGVIAQLLNELDGATGDNEGVFVLGATNAPWDIDAALKRPGRFDRTLLVLPPDAGARAAILDYHLRDRPVEGVDSAQVAAMTDGYSGADLAALAEAAAETALAESMESGTARPIRQPDLVAALRDVRPSSGAWFETARNFATFANESGAYDELLAYLRERRTV